MERELHVPEAERPFIVFLPFFFFFSLLRSLAFELAMIDEQALHAIRPELASLMKAAEECKIDFCIDTRKELTPYVKALLQSIEQGSGSEAEGAMGSKEILLREVRSAIFALGWNSEIESFSRPIEPRSFMDTLKWKMLWQDGLVGQGTYARVVK